jgi:hypothetical protein
MDDVAIIEVLRDAAEALSLCTFLATSEAAEAQLADRARECHDAAMALARRHLATTAEGG